MIKLKKFSSTKSTWDALENCINENCSGPIKELIAAGESQDKIKDTINYLIDHIMEGDSERNKMFSDRLLLGISEVKSKYSDMSEDELMDAMDEGEEVFKKPFITTSEYSNRKEAYQWFMKVLKDKGIKESDKYKYIILYWDDLDDMWIEY